MVHGHVGRRLPSLRAPEVVLWASAVGLCWAPCSGTKRRATRAMHGAAVRGAAPVAEALFPGQGTRCACSSVSPPACPQWQALSQGKGQPGSQQRACGSSWEGTRGQRWPWGRMGLGARRSSGVARCRLWGEIGRFLHPEPRWGMSSSRKLKASPSNLLFP